MRRTKAKAAGLGLALVAGWASGGTARSEPPALLPAAVRNPESAPAPLPPAALNWGTVDRNGFTDAVWMPAGAPRAADPAPAVPSVLPSAGTADPVFTVEIPSLPKTMPGPTATAVEVPAPTPVPAAPPIRVVAPLPIPPRVERPAPPPAPSPTRIDLPPVVVAPSQFDLPAPPVVPPRRVEPTAPPPAPAEKPSEPPAAPPRPMPTPEPLDPAPKLPQPRLVPKADPRPPVADDDEPAPMPKPRPAPTPPPQAELEPAPAEVLHGSFAGSTFHHRDRFGSPAVRLSRDYPPLWDFLHSNNGRAADGGEGVDGAGGTATDRLFVQLEYLVWRTNADRVPVLASTSTDPNGLGFLGQPSTVTLLGGGAYGPTTRPGFRARAGYWLDEGGTCGIDGSVFTTSPQSSKNVFDSAQFPVIARPVFAPNPGITGEFAEIVAAPNFSRGILTIENTSHLWGADVNVRKGLCRACDRQTEWFFGYRFLSLTERLRITEDIVATNNPPDVPGTLVTVQDQFATRNRFYGAQVGGRIDRRWGNFDVQARGSVALGTTHQELDITGSQTRLRPGMATPDTFVGGLLATPTNIGSYSRNRFSVVPELTLNVGYWVAPSVKVYAGYNVIYWSNVLRPGRQIDRVVDVTTVPNPPADVAASGMPRPRPTFDQSDLWVNGVQFGVEWRY